MKAAVELGESTPSQGSEAVVRELAAKILACTTSLERRPVGHRIILCHPDNEPALIKALGKLLETHGYSVEEFNAVYRIKVDATVPKLNSEGVPACFDFDMPSFMPEALQVYAPVFSGGVDDLLMRAAGAW